MKSHLVKNSFVSNLLVSLLLTQFSSPFSLAYVDYGSLSVFTVSPLYNSVILDMLCDSDLSECFLLSSRFPLLHLSQHQ